MSSTELGCCCCLRVKFRHKMLRSNRRHRERYRAGYVASEFAVLEDGERGGNGTADLPGLRARSTNQEPKYKEDRNGYPTGKELTHRTSSDSHKIATKKE